MPILKRFLKNNKLLLFFILVVLIFFYPTILEGKIPIASDTIIGLYHPFRDNVRDNFPLGIPVKNPLITDPVRQQYVWRFLSIENWKNLHLPSWNPYSFSGTPLAANFQSASFYPLNIAFLLFPFNIAWTLLAISGPLLSGVFLYFYLRYMKVSKMGSLLGAITYSFSGFSIAWFTWNTVTHALIWLPLILLSKEQLLRKWTFTWAVIFIFAEISLIFAGHLQILFYALIVSNIYLLARIAQLSFTKKSILSNIKTFVRIYLPFLIIGAIVLALTAIQWFPTLSFINLSARAFDQGSWMKPGWFIPWQHAVQFLVPDFFGNPTTGNYWGQWNYGEFIGYIGVLPLILALYALLFRKDKKTIFFSFILVTGLIFSFPTILAKLPFILNFPLLSTSQPTRLLSIVDFSLSILAAFGFDHLKYKNISIWKILLPLSLIFITLWITLYFPELLGITINEENLSVAKRNLIFPTFIFFTSSLYLIFYLKNTRFRYFFTILLFATLLLDLLRFSWKFTPFNYASFLFPETKILRKLKKEAGINRVLATDRRIMPPNFSVYYHLHDISGYDPLYIKRYGELIAAWGRGKPDISPASFNRILTPQDYESPITDLLGVKYVLSLKDELSPKLKLLDREGETRLYENLNVLPRLFLVNKILVAKDDQDEIEKLFSIKNFYEQVATSQEDIKMENKPLEKDETATIAKYTDNEIIININTQAKRLLILTDIFYPTWRVSIDGKQTKLYKVDYTLRGVLVPAGTRKVAFKNLLF